MTIVGSDPLAIIVLFRHVKVFVDAEEFHITRLSCNKGWLLGEVCLGVGFVFSLVDSERGLFGRAVGREVHYGFRARLMAIKSQFPNVESSPHAGPIVVGGSRTVTELLEAAACSVAFRFFEIGVLVDIFVQISSPFVVNRCYLQVELPL